MGSFAPGLSADIARSHLAVPAEPAYGRTAGGHGYSNGLRTNPRKPAVTVPAGSESLAERSLGVEQVASPRQTAHNWSGKTTGRPALCAGLPTPYTSDRRSPEPCNRLQIWGRPAVGGATRSGDLRRARCARVSRPRTRPTEGLQNPTAESKFGGDLRSGVAARSGDLRRARCAWVRPRTRLTEGLQNPYSPLQILTEHTPCPSVCRDDSYSVEGRHWQG
jgi:hypothetical protein